VTFELLWKQFFIILSYDSNLKNRLAYTCRFGVLTSGEEFGHWFYVNLLFFVITQHVYVLSKFEMKIVP
jgi:hypothetical protein